MPRARPPTPHRLGFVGGPVADEQVRAVGDGGRLTTRAASAQRTRPRPRWDAAGRYHAAMGVEDGWVEIGDRVFVRRYAFYDQNIGVVLGDGEALVIDTRSTYVQAREIVAAPPRADPVPGHGRRGHPRPLRSRLRQRGLPPGDDLGPRRLRDRSWSGPASSDASDRPRGTGPRRRTSPRSSSTRPTGRSPTRRPSRSAGGPLELALPRARPHRSRHRHRRARRRTCCSPATSSSRATCRSSATATRSTGRRPPRPWCRLVSGVVVPGHGDHAGRAFAESQAASIAALVRPSLAASTPGS